MKHVTKGAGDFCIYSIRDGNDNLLKVNSCKSENIRRVIRFYADKYPDYWIIPIVHHYRLQPYQNINDILQGIDARLKPQALYNRNISAVANAKRMKNYRRGFLPDVCMSLYEDYGEYDIYEDYHQQDETGDKLSYADNYNDLKIKLELQRRGQLNVYDLLKR